MDKSSLCSYLNLQGVVNENTNNLNDVLNVELFYDKPTPTTVIDLTAKQVHRTHLHDDFAYARWVEIHFHFQY